jgi:hypothetical protein
VRRVLIRSIAARLLSVAAGAYGAEGTQKPTRIVSLNVCTDELVLRLADRQNIASVTSLAASGASNVADLAAHVQANHIDALALFNSAANEVARPEGWRPLSSAVAALDTDLGIVGCLRDGMRGVGRWRGPSATGCI